MSNDHTFLKLVELADEILAFDAVTHRLIPLDAILQHENAVGVLLVHHKFFFRLASAFRKPDF